MSVLYYIAAYLCTCISIVKSAMLIISIEKYVVCNYKSINSFGEMIKTWLIFMILKEKLEIMYISKPKQKHN